MVFWKGQLRRVDNHFRLGKQLLSRGYSNTKHFLNKVNEGYEVGKEVYKILKPSMEAVSGSQNYNAIDFLLRAQDLAPFDLKNRFYATNHP